MVLKSDQCILSAGVYMKAVEDNPGGISKAEIVVGIPSRNEASSISFPTEQADKGLTKYYGERPAVIINCDNHSEDNTRQAFMDTPTKTPKIYLSTADGIKGKGNNLKNLFAKVIELSAKAVIVVDADLKSITPLWIRDLGNPLFDNYDYVAPLYVRHKYDGTLTTNIAYPLTRSLYGRRVRQPINGDYGFSGNLAEIYMKSEIWSEAAANFGIDIWMATLAMRRRVSVIQSFMGKPKIHKTKDPITGMVNIIRDVVETIFQLMVRFDSFWKDVKWSRPTAVYGMSLGDPQLPPSVEFDVKILSDHFLSGLDAHNDIYKIVLDQQNINKLEEVAELPAAGFEFPTGLWAKVVYDFAIAYKRSLLPTEQLIDVFLPLFYGKTWSFVLETQPMNTQQVEEFIEDQCLQFEKTKPYLVERWFSG
jgi:glycosyltransferase involved in cell wall biosynthesis